MSDYYPEITIIIPTLNRVDLLKQTLELLHGNISYSGALRYLIGNDGEQGPLDEMISGLPFARAITVIGDGKRHGLGGNVNRLLRTCETEIALQTQDDYHLCNPLYLDRHVRKLIEDDTAGWVKLRLIQSQRITARIDGHYWRVLWEQSPELYIASDQPHLKHIPRWHGHYGMYPEGVNIAATENTWCNQVKEIARTTKRDLDVLIPIEGYPDSSWHHRGDDISWQVQGY